MSNIIKQLEQEQMKQDVPSFRPGAVSYTHLTLPTIHSVET